VADSKNLTGVRVMVIDDDVDFAQGLAAILQDHGMRVTQLGDTARLLEDLEALGCSRAEILARMPPLTVAALVGAQYYWIFHYHPVALLGYILVVESEPPSVELVERTVAETGLPRVAFRSFFRHAVLEPAHNDALDGLLDSLPLSREQQGLIGVSVIQTSNMIARAAEEILEFHELAKTGSLPTAVVRSGDRSEKGPGL